LLLSSSPSVSGACQLHAVKATKSPNPLSLLIPCNALRQLGRTQTVNSAELTKTSQIRENRETNTGGFTCFHQITNGIGLAPFRVENARSELGLMTFWSTYRKRSGGRGASRASKLQVSAALILLSFTFCPVVAAHAEQWQKVDAHGYINDFAGVLNTATVEQLTALCAEVDQKAKAQIALWVPAKQRLLRSFGRRAGSA